MIGGFEIVDLAGHGGSSLVWRARHVSGTPAALEVLKGSVLHRPALREALELEVQRLASLDHAGIVQVYDAGVVTAEQAAASGGDLPLGSPWFALEWVGGGTLDQRLPMGWAELRPVVQQLLDALGASHGRGLLHLDLKPHNVLVRDLSVGWVPVITDFGIAARMGTAGTEGTEGFAPPEQLEGGERGPWTDLYALGRTIGSILAGRGVQPATVHPALPAWLGALTADEPGERPASSWEALERLPGTGPPVRRLRLKRESLLSEALTISK